jgi:hypothetical protein
MRMRRLAAIAAILAASLLASAWAGPAEGEIRSRIVTQAKELLGVPYVYGAESPPEALDCSGLVQYVYRRAADLELPRNSRQQAEAGKVIDGKGLDESNAKPGDLFVFDTVGSGGVSHVAIYLGGDEFIHALSEGPKTGGGITPTSDASFAKKYLGARYYIVSAVPGASSSAERSKPAPAAKAAPENPKAAPQSPKAMSASPQAREAEVPISQIAVSIRKPHDVVEDPIPAAAGTAIAFTVTNMSDKDGVFHIVFYKTGAKYLILREERVMLKVGQSQELAPYTFAEAGVYRLNVKSADNTQMMQRAWKVIDLKQKGR